MKNRLPFLEALKLRSADVATIILMESLVAVDLGCIRTKNRLTDMECSSVYYNTIALFYVAVCEGKTEIVQLLKHSADIISEQYIYIHT